MAWSGVQIVAAKRPVRAVPEVVPVTPEDVVKVCGLVDWFTLPRNWSSGKREHCFEFGALFFCMVLIR